ncbi:MAG: hypothetical protein RIQ41_564, partial [Candidatus Parcubacteria bacterium]
PYVQHHNARTIEKSQTYPHTFFIQQEITTNVFLVQKMF